MKFEQKFIQIPLHEDWWGGATNKYQPAMYKAPGWYNAILSQGIDTIQYLGLDGTHPVWEFIVHGSPETHELHTDFNNTPVEAYGMFANYTKYPSGFAGGIEDYHTDGIEIQRQGRNSFKIRLLNETGFFAGHLNVLIFNPVPTAIGPYFAP